VRSRFLAIEGVDIFTGRVVLKVTVVLSVNATVLQEP
jgi:hypothetical protein